MEPGLGLCLNLRLDRVFYWVVPKVPSVFSTLKIYKEASQVDFERAPSCIYLVRLMHGTVFKSYFESKFEEQKIQNHVRSSIPSILRVFFEFSNLSKTPKIIFFGQNFFLADVFQYGEHFQRGFEKIRETSIFEPFYTWKQK